MMRHIRIAGLGLATGLGEGAGANVSGLRQGLAAESRVTLDQLHPPLEVSYVLVPGAWQSAMQRFEGILRSAVAEALEGIDPAGIAHRGWPVFIGSSCHGVALAEARYVSALSGDEEDPLPMPIEGFGDIGQCLRRDFGLRGADFVFNTACTASANALLSACRWLQQGWADHALVVGLETMNYTSAAGFHGMQLLSDDGMRPFDVFRNGLVLGEGCGALLLSAEPDDRRDGIYIKGGASRCDNYSITASNPDGSAIGEVMQAALTDAGIGAGDIAAIKAHGTASPLNDDGEAAGILRIFAEPPPLFALKAYTGHTLGSCGVIETALAATAMDTGFIPSTAGFASADPALGVVPTSRAQVFDRGCVLLNFFGFGGNNNALVLEKR